MVVLCDGMGGCCERRGRKSAAKRQARKCRKRRQADAKLCLGVQYGSREVREDLIVARRRVRMGMGRSGRSLRGHTAYTDPFPSTLRKSRDLGGALQPTLQYTSPRFYGGEGLEGYRELAMAQTQLEGLAYVSKTLREPLAKTLLSQRSYRDTSRLCNTARRIPNTRKCLPQGRNEHPRRGAIASPHRDCTTIAS